MVVQEIISSLVQATFDQGKVHHRCGTGASMEWLPPDWCPSVVVIDIDGTITDGEKTPVDRGRVGDSAEDAGVPVVLATGNVRPITYGLWRFLGLSLRCVVKTVASSGTLLGRNRCCVRRQQRRKKQPSGWPVKLRVLIPTASPPTAGEKANGACFPMNPLEAIVCSDGIRPLAPP